VTAQADGARPGPVDGLARILRELLRTPRFKRSVGIIISELDPGSARLLVRTLVWEDVAFFLSLAGSSPDIVNTFIIALDELMAQMSNFPEPLLTGFTASIIEKLDGESLGRALAGSLKLASGIASMEDNGVKGSLNDLKREVVKGFAGDRERATRKMVDSLLPMVSEWMGRAGKQSLVEGSPTNLALKAFSEGIRHALEQNPEFVRGVAAPLADAWRDALDRAGESDE